LGEVISATVNWAKAKGATKFGYIGFCYGAWAGFRAAQTGDFCVGVNAHPSLILEKFVWKGDDEGLGKTAKCNMLLMPAKDDAPYYSPGGALLEALHANGYTDSQATDEFRDQAHGFVTRGDLKDEVTCAQVTKALAMSKEYLAKYLK